METNEYRAHCIKKAGAIALLGNLALAATKLVLAYFSHSLAVLGDGIDSSTDVLIAIVTLAISSVIMRPGDSEHPWGHGRAETTATMILTFIIFLAGSQLAINSTKRILMKNFSEDISMLAILSSLISIAGKFLLSLSQTHYAKKSNSDILKANASNMRNDIILSAGVLAGVGAAKLFRCPVLDPAVAVVIGLWVVKNSVFMFIDLNRELMDGNNDKELYKKLFEAVSSVQGVENPHKARIRKIASLYDIDLDIEVDPAITVYEAHEKAELVEDEIRKAIPDLYDVVIHIEPAGSDNHQRKEEYGLSPDEL